MRFQLEFDTDNAAFDELPATEIARILRKVADVVVHNGDFDGLVVDMNGNVVGRYSLTKARR
ncbi:hypothetical protein HAP48_0035075 [Bradyrhizobium septentrionale]|uniref:Uncharacterized protein n=1 Tax=Bradyrhizobium septentrionale TaxID=1404411 RepID=A0A973W0G1_9BRAD|nr:hypothetical protein [Bradyrhizobium septentrionale]UGY13757.1 hypothetical protein HAP48_0035075 [Bradyrhizobium septentrionale]